MSNQKQEKRIVAAPFEGDQTKLIAAIVKNGRMNKSQAEDMLAHNVITPKQFMQLTGVARATFNTLCAPKYSQVSQQTSPPVLKRVFPFFHLPESDDAKTPKDGVIYILRDEKCEAKLYEYNHVSK